MANQEIQKVQYGVILPADLPLPDIVTFAKQAERLGFSFVAAYDQTALTPTSRITHPVRSTADPFSILSAIAQQTTEIELYTTVLALPQRPTVLVARQAADVDILSNGRLRIGVGAGFDRELFSAYGRREIYRGRLGVLESQIEVLQELWKGNTLNTTTGVGEVLTEVRLDPLPVQKPIPVFVGSGTKGAYIRAARGGQGMISFDLSYQLEEIPSKKKMLVSYLVQNRRDVATFPFMVNANLVGANRETFARIAQLGSEGNFSHLAFNTITTEGRPLSAHITDLEFAQRELGLRRR